MKPISTDQHLIDLVRQGDQLALAYAYQKYRLLVHQYVVTHHGNLQDAQDVYQDVMLAFCANAQSGKLRCLHGKLSTYLHKLAQNLWHTYLRRHEPLRGALDLTDYPLEQPADAAADDLLQWLLNKLDVRCRLILRLYYFEGLSMRDVAGRVGLSGADSARKRKCDCLARLKELASRLSDEAVCADLRTGP